MDVSLITDWLGREGGALLSWWLLVTLAGAAVWPLLFRLMGGLPDRGYTLARPAGIMLTGFVFWFMASLGLVRNTPGAMVLAGVIVAAVSWGVFLRWEGRPALRPWLRENGPLILTAEIVFALLFVGWSLFRAHNPEMSSTEKPMEIMFLNGIRASDTFPPRDPWLAGYSISYYYFGYVIAAMLSDLSGVASGLGFNLNLALLFAMTGTGALGVVYNMVRFGSRRRIGRRGAALVAGALALCFLILMGNLGTALVEIPYRGHAPEIASTAYFDFWDVEERGPWRDATSDFLTAIQQMALFRPLNLESVKVYVPQDSDRDGVPDWDDEAVPLESWGQKWSPSYWWWFRYSRVVHDRDLSDQPIGTQPIAEVPSFSFVLGDMHPHVLALPFAVLAVGLMLNLVLRGRDPAVIEIPLYAICIGGMIFMNSWDAIYLPLLIAAEVLRRLIRGRGALSTEDLMQTIRFGVIAVALTLILYAPWILTFTSQASGILPNLIYPTAWQQYFLQFGVFLVILLVFLIVEAGRAGRRFHWQAGLLAAVFLLVALVVIAAIQGNRIWEAPNAQNLDAGRLNAALGTRGVVYAGADTSQSWTEVMGEVLRKRMQALPSEAALLLMVFLVAGRLFARPVPAEGDEADITPPYSPATGFALLLAGAGAVLTFAPDFVYLHDNFGVRINTVFKLYYQGWVLFSLAAGFAVWSVLPDLLGSISRAGETARPRPRALAGQGIFALAAAIFFAAGMVYPAIAFRSRAVVETERWCEAGECPNQGPLTLNGAPTMVSPGEYQAIQCLARIEQDRDAVIAEAPGGAYNSTQSRFSSLTGIPTLIGWQNHEGQWRGESYGRLVGSRVDDLRELYRTQDWERTWEIIDRYGIDYVVVGNAERFMIEEMARQESGGQADQQAALVAEYTKGLEKFAQLLQPVCATEAAVVYRVAPN